MACNKTNQLVLFGAILLITGCADSPADLPFAPASLAGDRACISEMSDDGQTLVMACDGSPGTEASVQIFGIDPDTGLSRTRQADFADFNARAPSLLSKGLKLADRQLPLSQGLQPDRIRFLPGTGMVRIILGINNAEALISLDEAVIEQLAVVTPPALHWPAQE